jgi:hypothetical protein
MAEILRPAQEGGEPGTAGVARQMRNRFTRFASTLNERMKKPIKAVIRYIFVTVASLRKPRKLWRCVTN